MFDRILNTPCRTNCVASKCTTHFKNHFTQNSDPARKKSSSFIIISFHKILLALKIQLTDPQKIGDLTKISRQSFSVKFHFLYSVTT